MPRIYVRIHIVLFRHHLYLMAFRFLIAPFSIHRFSHMNTSRYNWKYRKKKDFGKRKFSNNFHSPTPVFIPLLSRITKILRRYARHMYSEFWNAYLSVYIPCPYVLSARDYPYRCFRMMKIDKQIILVGELVYMGIVDII